MPCHIGESMEDYRERLEPVLMAELLDENGEIKDKYKNDPEMSEWAEWAKAQYDKNDAVAKKEIIADHESTPEQIQEVAIGVENASWNQNRQLKQETLGIHTDASVSVDAVIKETTDAAVDDVKAADTMASLDMSG